MIKVLIDKMKLARNIVFFSGAGVSTNSGLKDFRGKDGLYKEDFMKYHPEEILSHQFFFEHTALFYQYYKAYFLSTDPKPNIAHQLMALLEEKGKNVCVITQNIDGLHQLAGSKHVLELHGSIFRNYTVKSRHFIAGIDYIKQSEGIPRYLGEIVKPDVVLYGEALPEHIFSEVHRFLNQADLIVVVGTSLTVYPASQLVYFYQDKDMYAINNEALPIKNMIVGEIGDVFAVLYQAFNENNKG